MLNNCNFIGRLTSDPECAVTGEHKYARFSIAINSYNKEKIPTYIPAVCWNKRAILAEQFLKKGSKVCLTGRIETSKIKNDDGRSFNWFQLVVSDIVFLESVNEK